MSAAPNSGPVLDPAVIENLRQLTPPGEPDVLAEVLELFLQDVPRRLTRLRASCDAGDAAELHKTAHSLKGSAGNIGAPAMFAICHQLDDQARAGDLSDAKRLIDALEAEFARVEVAIRQILAA